MLHPNPAVHRLLRLLQLLLLSCAALLFFRFLFRPLLPLGAAFLLSSLIAGPTERLCKKIPLPRGLWALLLTLGLVTALFWGGWLLGKLALSQAKALFGQLPTLVSGLEEGLLALQDKLERWLPGQQTLPRALSPTEWVAGIQPPEIDMGTLAGSVEWAATSLPDLLLTTVFVLAATVLLTGHRAEIMGFVKRQLPPRFAEALGRLRSFLAEALAGWCKAQGILMAVTFGLLLVGFLFLRVEAAVLLAFVISLMDGLPVLGAGLILVPWALIQLLLGRMGRAAGLALLFAAVTAVRNLLEPHVVGRQLGLHPFVSLVSFYLGWRLAGIAGMLLAPCVVLILVKLQEWGYSKLWR